MTVRLVQAQAQTEALAWLLSVLRSAADELEEGGDDVDANVIRAHAAQLQRGREWPGDPIDAVHQERFVTDAKPRARTFFCSGDDPEDTP